MSKIVLKLSCILFLTILVNPLLAQQIDYSEYEVKTQYWDAYINNEGVQFDTVFIHNNKEIHIKLEKECLMDSVIEVFRIDTNDKNKTIHKFCNVIHNDNIVVTVSQNNKQKEYIFDKMVFTEVVWERMIIGNNYFDVKLNTIMQSEPKILFSATFCKPGTDYCNEAIALFNWKTGEIEFMIKNSMVCWSKIQVKDDKVILTNDVLYDFKGDTIRFFGYYTAFSEFISDTTFLVVRDPYILETDKDGGYTKYKDTVCDNAVVYNLEGEILYSFNYEGYYMPLEYYVSEIRHNGWLYLFDFKNNKYYIPKSKGVKVFNLVEINDPSVFSDFKEFKVGDNNGQKSVFVSGRIAVYKN